MMSIADAEPISDEDGDDIKKETDATKKKE